MVKFALKRIILSQTHHTDAGCRSGIDETVFKHMNVNLTAEMGCREIAALKMSCFKKVSYMCHTDKHNLITIMYSSSDNLRNRQSVVMLL